MPTMKWTTQGIGLSNLISNFFDFHSVKYYVTNCKTQFVGAGSIPDSPAVFKKFSNLKIQNHLELYKTRLSSRALVFKLSIYHAENILITS